MPDRYGVFGNPISHSQSPFIHGAFAKQTQQDIVYDAFLIEEDQFAARARAFFREGGRGLNITVPFKENAYTFADALTPQAQAAGAVNTLIYQADGKVLGENTDGYGLLSDLRRLSWHVATKKVLLIGAGGAARGVLPALLREQPALLCVSNRSAEKARHLAGLFAAEGNICGGGYELMHQHRFDLVINATSASLFGDTPPLPEASLASNCAAYDMVYGSEVTPFLALAKGFGVQKIADGLGMLVGQAAESFYLWRRVRPQVSPVIEQLKKSF